MTDAAAAWKCKTCMVVNDADATRCAACEEFKEPPALNGPPILFGGGAPAAPLNFDSRQSIFATTSTAAPPPPATTTTTAPVVGQTFTSMGVTPAPPMSSAPSTALTFCKAMTTPSRTQTNETTQFLIGCSIDDLMDKTECGTVKIQPGQLMTWGCSECDQLPIKVTLLDDFLGLTQPAAIRAFEGGTAVMICCGSLTSFALDTNNHLWSWGCSDNGPLGRPIRGREERFSGVTPAVEDAPIVSGKVPERVWGLPKGDKIVKIVAGDSHAGVLTESGDVWLWGHYRDFTGPLGFWDSERQEVVEIQWCPQKIALPGVALDIASGENHTIVLVERGGERSLVVIGSNEFGQLCTLPSAPPLPEGIAGPTSTQRPPPVVLTPAEITPHLYQDIRHQYLKPHVLPFAKLNFRRFENNCFVDMNEKLVGAKLTRVCTGSATTFLKVVTEDDDCHWFSCGRGLFGELGVGFADQNIYEPTLLAVPALCVIDYIVGGDFASFALTTDGSVWAWGKGESCGLGISSHQSAVMIPQAITGLRNKVAAVCAGMKTTFAVSYDGRLLVWGDGANYQHGTGDVEDEPALVPTLVDRSRFNNQAVVAVAAGASHAVALINATVERRGLKRQRLEEPDEMPSCIKRSKLNDILEDKARLSFKPVIMTDDATPGGDNTSNLEESQPSQVATVHSPASTAFEGYTSPQKKEPDRTPAFFAEPAREETAAAAPDAAPTPTDVPIVEPMDEESAPAAVAAPPPPGDHQVKITRIHKDTSSAAPVVTPSVVEEVDSNTPSAAALSTKPRDSLTAVLISPDGVDGRPFDATPKPATGMSIPEKDESDSSVDSEFARERLNEEQREEEQISAAPARGRGRGKAKAKAKPKAKSKAKSKAKAKAKSRAVKN